MNIYHKLYFLTRFLFLGGLTSYVLLTVATIYDRQLLDMSFIKILDNLLLWLILCGVIFLYIEKIWGKPHGEKGKKEHEHFIFTILLHPLVFFIGISGIVLFTVVDIGLVGWLYTALVMGLLGVLFFDFFNQGNYK